MLIFLVGYMGCGKTTFGRRLAAGLGWTFADLDELIEERYKITIHDFFEKYGEENFRRVENMMLRELFTQRDLVISTGGGTPCFYNNMELMNKHGETIFLDTHVGVIVDRLYHGKRKRPLVAGLDHDQLSAKVDHHLASRMDFYRQAKHRLTLEEQNPALVQKMLGI